MSADDDVRDWEARGRRLSVDGRSVWVLDVPALDDRVLDPLLVLHGFPSCSFDWRHVLDALRAQCRVVAVDFLGFGLSDKPDVRYSMRLQADVVEAVARELGLTSVALLTHDMGDTVGGELLARSMEATLPFAVTRRVLTNGSIYIDMAHLTTGQQLLLSLDDAPTDLVQADGFKAGLAGTFAAGSAVAAEELDAQCSSRRATTATGSCPAPFATSRTGAPRSDASPARSRVTRRRSRWCGVRRTRSQSSR